MADTFEDFALQYRDLAVVTCEWRAFGLEDPQDMANTVLERLRRHKAEPSLQLFYKVVEGVVDDAYRAAAGKRTITETIFAGSWPFPRRESKTQIVLIREALQSLPIRDANLMRQAYWDELTFDEMAAVNGRDAATQKARLEAALARFAARLPKDNPSGPEAAMRRIHPGEYRRHGTTKATPSTYQKSW